jgi:peptide alpha-N-acetyltransferase
VPALGLYTSLGFVPEKRLHRFYLNGKDAFRLVLPLCGADDAAATSSVASVPSDKQQLGSTLLQLPPPPHGASDDDDDDDDDDEGVCAASAVRTGSKLVSSSLSRAEDEEDYAENTAKLVRLRRRVAALRACRMITVWPAEDNEDRVSGR